MNRLFWQNKKVLITGHTGFKGGWLSLWLQHLGAQVTGFSLAPPTEPNLFNKASIAENINSIIGDIRDSEHLSRVLQKCQPDIVFHLAAQPLVRESYQDPVGTYTTNVIGSLNVLEAIRHCHSVRAAVIVSTDKCYENQEWHWGYRENDPVGGHDPYSSSKACMEILLASYRKSYFQAADPSLPAIASARAGNVIGGGDWAKDRLIPDTLQAISHQQPIYLRYPNAIRPWQHVLEPLSGYLLLAEKLYNDGHAYAQSWNFGPPASSAKSVKWLVDYLLQQTESKIELIIDKESAPHEAHFLKLDFSKANEQLDWQPRWDLATALDKVIDWSMPGKHSALSMQTLCIQQIDEYSDSKTLTL
ncbi:CDP-glucose 4,6-dehydratase [uncultured Paraglaciecola sp.]|uniref:CDP-glucose 4,6-dehydratase n=1 Tax=uncultured Paraglaciecola sp. TaxID=1765024 RepID=UPI00261BB9D9|nr:CDP-glucose 4,6-dehydratase [uncultured Paraglaciecola sp.]